MLEPAALAPPGKRRVERAGAVQAAIGVATEGVFASGRLVVLRLNRCRELLCTRCRLLSRATVTQQHRNLRHGCRRLLVEQGQIDLLVRLSARPALDPACTLYIVVDAVPVRVMRGFKLPGAHHFIAVCPKKVYVTARSDVVHHGEQK